MNTPNINIENAIPILRVRDMRTSRAFYVEILGFTEADWGTDEFTCVSRDAGSIYLCCGAQGNTGTWVWVGFDGDIHAWYEYLRRKKVPIIQSPVNRPWAMEMHVEDPDGHVLRFGKEPEGDQTSNPLSITGNE